VAAFRPSPHTAVYAASKAFVTSFSEGLHYELAPHGVTVSTICPGFTRTEFQDRAEYDIDGIPDALWQTAEEVAEAALEGVARKRSQVVPGGLNRAAVAGLRFLPSAITRRVAPGGNQ